MSEALMSSIIFTQTEKTTKSSDELSYLSGGVLTEAN